MSNWKDHFFYNELAKAESGWLAWEFLRLNKEYQEDYRRYNELRMQLAKYGFKQRPANLLDAYQSLEKQLCHKWHLRTLPDPSQDFIELQRLMQHPFQMIKIIKNLDDIEDFIGDEAHPKDNESASPQALSNLHVVLSIRKGLSTKQATQLMVQAYQDACKDFNIGVREHEYALESLRVMHAHLSKATPAEKKSLLTKTRSDESDLKDVLARARKYITNNYIKLF